MKPVLCFLAAAGGLLAQSYQKPPQAVLDVLHAKPVPTVQVSPAKTHLLLMDAVRHPSIADLARPMLRLAGLRIDPASNGPHLTSYVTGLTILDIATRRETKVGLPANARLFAPVWSPDGARVAAANQTNTRTELWVITIATGAARKLPAALHAVLDQPIHWMPDNRTLLVTLVAPGPRAGSRRPNHTDRAENSREHRKGRPYANLSGHAGHPL